MTNIMMFNHEKNPTKTLPDISAKADAACIVIDIRTKGVKSTKRRLDTNPKLLTVPALFIANAKRTQRLIATLTVTAFKGKPSKKVFFKLGNGVLKIGDKEITHETPIILGTAAGIAGVTSVILKAEGLPEEGIKLLLGRRQMELEQLDCSVKYFFLQFRTGYDTVKNSVSCSREAVDRCESEEWGPACDLLPPEMRQVEGLRRGVYGDDGWPLTARQIEQQAQGASFLEAFKEAIGRRGQDTQIDA